jgi:hypothetical protein
VDVSSGVESLERQDEAMSQPPIPPGGGQPPQNQPWHSEDTQQIPPQGPPQAPPPAQQPYAGAYSQPSGNPYNPYNQPPQGPPPGAPQYGPWQPVQPQQRQRSISDANPLRAAFDFRFTTYATPGLVKIIYILAAILAGIWWIGGALAYLLAGGPVIGIVWLLLGWIPALLWMLFVRIILEASLALVRVADDTRSIRTKIEN